MKKTNQAQPAPTHNNDGEEAAGSTVTVLANRKDSGDKSPSRGPVLGWRRFVTAHKPDEQARFDAKAKLLSTASQLLSEAVDLSKEGDETAKEVLSITNRAGLALYQGMAAGAVAQEEIADVMRQQFGARKKGDAKTRVSATDPNASKTAFGKGEELRKRIVRATHAYDYIVNGKASAFFDRLPVEAVREVFLTLPHVEDGEWVNPPGASIWSAYDAFTAIKRQGVETTPVAFNYGRVLAISAKLSENAAATVQLLANDSALLNAYGAILDAFDIIGPLVDDELSARMAAQEAAQDAAE